MCPQTKRERESKDPEILDRIYYFFSSFFVLQVFLVGSASAAQYNNINLNLLRSFMGTENGSNLTESSTALASGIPTKNMELVDQQI